MSFEKPIIVDREVFNHLSPDTKLDALILKKLGRLIFQDEKKQEAS